MPTMTQRQLLAAGVTAEDLELAKITQHQQRLKGVRVQSLAEICGLAKPGRQDAVVVDITPKQLRQRGALGQAALLAAQHALSETSPERAEQARFASQLLTQLSQPHQFEFDFFRGGNVSIAHQYQDAVTERLFASAPTKAKALEAQAILWQITRHLQWQSYVCDKTAADLCEITRTDKADMTRALNLLEQVGAIRRVKKGRTKVITVTPEGAYRGDVNKHNEVVQRYHLEVIKGGKADEASPSN